MFTISIWIASVSLLVAVVTSIATFNQAKGLKLATEAETYFKLASRFDSTEFRSIRRAAALVCGANLKTKSAGTAVDDLLDFFEDIAFWVKKGAMDKQTALHGFYHWIRLYYESSLGYIAVRTESEEAVWKNLKWLYPILQNMESGNGNTVYLQSIDDDYLKNELQYEFEMT